MVNCHVIIKQTNEDGVIFNNNNSIEGIQHTI
jgi:hypothetical protein